MARSRAGSRRTAFMLLVIVVVFAVVIAGVFGLVTLVSGLQGPHVPSGWVSVTYTVSGSTTPDERDELAKSVAFRLHMGQAADPRFWVQDDGFVVAVPASDRQELEALPDGAPGLDFGGVDDTGSVGTGKITSADGCRKPPSPYACDRERNGWYQLAKPALGGGDVARTRIQPDRDGTGALAVVLRFDPDGSKRLADLTTTMSKSTGDKQRLAVVFGGIVLDAPAVKEPITQGVVSLPGFSRSEAEDLTSAISASRVDATLSKGPIVTS